jgi:hypothetical protein
VELRHRSHSYAASIKPAWSVVHHRSLLALGLRLRSDSRLSRPAVDAALVPQCRATLFDGQFGGFSVPTN